MKSAVSRAVFRIGGEVLPEGFHQVGHAFVEIRDALGDKEDNAQGRICGKSELRASGGTILRSEDRSVDRVGDVDHRLSASERGAAGFVGQPATARHESQGAGRIDPLFLLPYTMREIARRTSVGEIGARSARLAVVRAGQCQVTDTGHGPNVVHRPHDRFSVAEYAFQLVEGEQTLVDPMQ